MSGARSVECVCTYNFTCGYCCRNAKPPHSTSYNPTFLGSSWNDAIANAKKKNGNQNPSAKELWFELKALNAPKEVVLP